MEFIIRIYQESAAFETKDTERIIRQLLRIIYLWLISASAGLRVSPFVLARAFSRRGTISPENKCDTRSFSPQSCASAHALAMTDGMCEERLMRSRKPLQDSLASVYSSPTHNSSRQTGRRCQSPLCPSRARPSAAHLHCLIFYAESLSRLLSAQIYTTLLCSFPPNRLSSPVFVLPVPRPSSPLG